MSSTAAIAGSSARIRCELNASVCPMAVPAPALTDAPLGIWGVLRTGPPSPTLPETHVRVLATALGGLVAVGSEFPDASTLAVNLQAHATEGECLAAAIRRLPPAATLLAWFDGVVPAANWPAAITELSSELGRYDAALFAASVTDAGVSLRAFADETGLDVGCHAGLAAGDVVAGLVHPNTFTYSVFGEPARTALAIDAVATDGHRMARAETAAPEGSKGMPGIIIPKKTVGEVQKLLRACQQSTTPRRDEAIVRVLLETGVRRAMIMSDGSPLIFVERPISLAFVLLVLQIVAEIIKALLYLTGRRTHYEAAAEAE